MKVLTRYYIYIPFLILLILFSCTDENKEILASYETAKITFRIPLERKISNNVELSSGLTKVPSNLSSMDRGRIPSYVKEIRVTATHKTYKNENNSPVTVTKIFAVNEDDTSSEITPCLDIPLGENIITVETIPQEDEMGKYLIGYNKDYYNIPICPASVSSSDRVRYYSDILTKKQATYFEYTGTKEINVEMKNTNVSIDMSTVQSRLNIVFENISKYPSAYIVNYWDRSLFYLQMPIVGAGTASACVLNRADLSENDIEVVVKCFTPDASGDFSHIYMIYENLEKEAGVNRTVVFRLNRDKEL